MREGQAEVDYKWSVLATNPDATGAGWVQRRALLQSLKMHVPTREDLARADRRVLDAYLANGLGIELHARRDEQSSDGSRFDFALGTLPIVERHQFVLTLDFVMKMLCMNERIECGVPCIMEGETGVSKTALTRMLFALRNTSARTASALEQAVARVPRSDAADPSEHSFRLRVLRALADHFGIGDQMQRDAAVWQEADRLADGICACAGAGVAEALLADIRADPALDPLAEVDATVLETCGREPAAAAGLLKWYVATKVKPL